MSFSGNNARIRQGAALIAVLVLIAAASLLITGIFRQVLTNRRTLERRALQLQSTWLARAGLEIATQKLANAKDYTGETLQIDQGRVRISVHMEKEGFRVVSEARYPAEHPSPVVREAQRVLPRRASEDLSPKR